MIPEDIKKLIANIPRKKRDNPEPEMFQDSVKPPLITVYTVDILKPEEDSTLTTWKFESPPMT